MNNRTLVTNAVLAAMYIAVTALIQPFGFTNIQFRLSEIFNHLIVFNKRYFFGIALGVFLANTLFSSLGLFDLTFGLAHSVLSLLITIIFGRYIKNIWILLMINTFVFSFNMYIIAFMLKLALGLPFIFTWVTTFISEFVVMAIGIPLIYMMHKRLKFDTLV